METLVCTGNDLSLADHLRLLEFANHVETDGRAAALMAFLHNSFSSERGALDLSGLTDDELILLGIVISRSTQSSSERASKKSCWTLNGRAY